MVINFEELKWNSDGKKVMILVGDAPPHGCGGKQIAQQTTDPFGFRRRKMFNRGDNYPDGDPCEWTISVNYLKVPSQKNV